MGFRWARYHLCPTIRRGIPDEHVCEKGHHQLISSVLPWPYADPHGFSIDIMSEGGASGSPIFRTDDPRAIGILHGGFPAAPITYGVPGHLLQSGLEVATTDWNPDLSNISTLREVMLSQRPS